ncbi:MAG: hypothetical protein KDK53_17030 [Maritimibacter sp.]|nr:hypothetical protein [Maritimibacter sp.]
MPIYTFEMPILGSAPVSGTNYYSLNSTFVWTGETMTVSVYDDDTLGIGDDAPYNETGELPTVVSVNGQTTHAWVGQSFVIGGVRDLSTDGSWDIGVLKVGGEWIASTFVHLEGADVTVLPGQTYGIVNGSNPPREMFPEGTMGEIALNSTQDVLDKHGVLGLAAKLSMAAYRLDRTPDGLTPERELWGYNHREGARDAMFEELREDLHFLSSAELDASVGTEAPTAQFPRAGLDDGIYTNLNAAALVARTDDALFLSFRGTNDNTSPGEGIPDTPDGRHWIPKGQHWDLFDPLMTALVEYLGNHGEITDVYVSGHSLGGAMVEAFMEEMRDTRRIEFHANPFASPGYEIGVLGDDRITNLWIQDDPILGIASWTGDNDGDKNKIFHNLFDDGHLDKDDDVEATFLHRPEYYVAFVEFMRSQGIDEKAVSGRALYGIDYDRFYMDAETIDRKMSIEVGVGGTTLDGSRKNDVILGGRGGDILYGNEGRDYLDGGTQRDILVGGNGRDFLYGQEGNDKLTGGKHADLFVFKTNWDRDTIKDFDAKGLIHDRIDLSGLKSVHGWSDLKNNHLVIDGNDVLIDGNRGDVLVLENVSLNSLDKGDFVF